MAHTATVPAPQAPKCCAVLYRVRIQVMAQGFDSAFIRCFNYYFAYCEAGFASRTENLCMLVFARPGTEALDPNTVASVLAR